MNLTPSLNPPALTSRGHVLEEPGRHQRRAFGLRVTSRALFALPFESFEIIIRQGCGQSTVGC
jgi:hypothetical protein